MMFEKEKAYDYWLYMVYLLSLLCRKTVYRVNVTVGPNTYTVWSKKRDENHAFFISNFFFTHSKNFLLMASFLRMEMYLPPSDMMISDKFSFFLCLSFLLFTSRTPL